MLLDLYFIKIGQNRAWPNSDKKNKKLVTSRMKKLVQQLRLVSHGIAQFKHKRNSKSLKKFSATAKSCLAVRILDALVFLDRSVNQDAWIEFASSSLILVYQLNEARNRYSVLGWTGRLDSQRHAVRFLYLRDKTKKEIIYYPLFFSHLTPFAGMCSQEVLSFVAWQIACNAFTLSFSASRLFTATYFMGSNKVLRPLDGTLG